MARGDRPPAILHRDGETFAVVVDVPAGLTNPEQLRRIAEVGEKYQVAAIKITGAQRIALVGLKEEQLETIWQDLGMNAAHALLRCPGARHRPGRAQGRLDTLRGWLCRTGTAHR